jgi:hypothetical protein
VNPPLTPSLMAGIRMASRNRSQLSLESWTATTVKPPADWPAAWKSWPSGRLSFVTCTASSSASYCAFVPPGGCPQNHRNYPIRCIVVRRIDLLSSYGVNSTNIRIVSTLGRPPASPSGPRRPLHQSVTLRQPTASPFSTSMPTPIASVSPSTNHNTLYTSAVFSMINSYSSENSPLS